MSRKYAVIQDNVVFEILELEAEDAQQKAKVSQAIIDITDADPQPMERWVLNGNKLEVPQGLSDREQLEIQLSSKKTDAGIKIARICVDRIGARNKILNKNGTQVAAILNSLMPVKLLLETGALGTARYSCSQLKLVYTEYADVFDYAIAEINAFEQSHGL